MEALFNAAQFLSICVSARILFSETTRSNSQRNQPVVNKSSGTEKKGSEL